MFKEILFQFYFKMKKYTLPTIGLSAILACFSCSHQNNEPANKNFSADDENPWNYVNPFIGTQGEGHTYPGATVPFGMVQLSPDTEIKYFRQSFPWCAGYQYTDSTIIGFSHTHFSGTGHSDMGDVLIMPTVGTLKLSAGSSANPDSGYRSRFSHANESAQPGYYQVLLQDYNINAELTTTERAGFHQYTFPKSDSAHIILDLIQSIYNYDQKVLLSQIRVENDSMITGFRQTNGWGPNRILFFAIKFSKPFQSYGIVNEDEPLYKGFGKKAKHLENYPEVIGKKLVAYFNFKTYENEVIMLKVGISGVDIQGALKNIDTEIADWDFTRVRNDARQKWEKHLSKIIIDGSHRDKEIFYTALYHSMLAPTIYCDVDGRYRGNDNAIHEAKGFTNYSTFSLWDTYRATHPLFTIMHPGRDGEMIQSMIGHSQQHVHRMLPVWSFQGNETWCMIGYHSVSVIADAYLKGIRNFNTEDAFTAMKNTAGNKNYGGIHEYRNSGFVPVNKEKEGASKTLEYAYDDWAISQMAGRLGEKNDEAYFFEQGYNYKNVFDPETRFMRARNSDGTFREPFDPLYARYGGDYTEGNAWQYSWYVPQDVQGLINLHGGEETFCKMLDSLFVIETDDEKYKEVEDIAGLIGQYAQGNEPSQHIAYLYNYAGKPWKTQEKIHRIMNHLFDNTPSGICGNEDCGQMSAWYIFSSLGFYPVCPGSNEYVFGTPSIPKAVITLENGKQFSVLAENLSDENKYIQSVTLNGNGINRSFIKHDEILAGGTLLYKMGNKPNTSWATSPESRPYSMSK